MALKDKAGGGMLRRWFAERTLRRIYRNAGVLLSGKSVAGLLSLGYLALAARALGPERFGVLVLIHGYALAIGNLVSFNAWQAVIRYGSLSLQDERRGDFQTLLRFTALLDVASGLAGIAVAAALAPFAAPLLGWPPEVVPLAAAYSIVILFALKSTPTGVLRLFDRFDLVAVKEVVSPAVRLAGAGVAYLAGAGLAGFVAVWFLSGVVEGVVLWAFGLRELGRQGMLAGLAGWPHGATGLHRGLWGFVWSTNVNASLSQARTRLAPLAVGWLLGPAAAGLYHVALRLATVLAQLARLLRETVYPELARLVAQDELKAVKRVVLRAGLLAGAGGLPVLLVLLGFGRPMLELVGGEGFAAAYGLLVLLALARIIHLLGFPLGSALVALGRPGLALRVNLAASVLFVPTLFALLDWLGLIGAGINAAAFAAATVGVMAVIVLRLLSRRGRAKLRRKAATAAGREPLPDQPATAGGAAAAASSGPLPPNRARNG